MTQVVGDLSWLKWGGINTSGINPAQYGSASGNVITTYTYNSTWPNLIETVTTPDESTESGINVTKYVYYTAADGPNKAGQVKSIIYAFDTPLQAEQDFDYDQYGNKSQEIDEYRNVTNWQYDALDRLTKETLPDPANGLSGPDSPNGPTTKFTYDAAGNVLTTTDALNRVTSDCYDDEGQLIAEVRPDPNVHSSTPLPVTFYAYSPAGRQTDVYDALGNDIKHSEYDAAGRLHMEDDGGGMVTTFQYDNLNRLIEEDRPTPNIVNGAADPNPSNTTKYEYNEQGMVSKMTEADPGTGDSTAPVTTYDYVFPNDPRYTGHYVETISDPRNAVTEKHYDGLMRVVEERDADPFSGQATNGGGNPIGPVTDTFYDAPERVVVTADPLGLVTVSKYDARDRLTDTMQPNPGSIVTAPAFLSPNPPPAPLPSPETKYVYSTLSDGRTMVASVDVPNSIETDSVYDHLGRLFQTREPDAVTGIASVTNATGQSVPAAGYITYGYDAVGNKTSQTDERGNTTTWKYDALDRVVKQIDPAPGTPFDSVGGTGQAAGPVTTWVYDAVGNQVAMIDPDRNVTQSGYDLKGGAYRKVWTVQPDPRGATAMSGGIVDSNSWIDVAGNSRAADIFTYYASGKLKSDTFHDPVEGTAATTGFTYDNLYRRISETDPAPDASHPAPLSTFHYDADGNLTSVRTQDRNASTSSVGPTTVYQYDFLNRKTAEIDPDPTTGLAAGATTNYVYEFDNNVRQVTGPLPSDGRVRPVTYNYFDGLNRLQESVGPDPNGIGPVQPGPATVYQYNTLGELYKLTDPQNQTTTTNYDDLHRKTSVVEPTGLTTGYGYDLAGNETTVTVPGNTPSTPQVTQTVYDNLNRPIDVIEPDPSTGQPNGPATQTRYDADGNPVITISPTGMTEQRFDGLNRLVDTILPNPQTGLPTGRGTVSAFDGAGNLLSVIDPDYNVTSYTYNVANQRTSQTITIYDTAGHPVPATTSWTYDSAGNLASQVDADGRTIRYGYDALNRKTSETWYVPGSGTPTESISFGYDSFNRLTSEGDANSTYVYDYDNGGRLASATETVGTLPAVQFTYHYNADDFQTETDVAFNGALNYTNIFTPDALERVQSVAQSGPAVAPKSVKFDYDPQTGNLAHLTRYADAVLATPVLQTTDSLDDAGRLSAITDSQIVGGHVVAPAVAAYSWQYEPGSDRVEQFTSLADGTTVYRYDHQDQLITATLTPPGMSPGEPNEAYAYDANGNRTNANGNSYTPTLDNEIQSDGTFTYKYDAVGNRTGRTRIANNPADDYQTIYTYDNRNRLIDVKYENNAGTPTKEVSYAYDAENELIQRTVTPYTGGVSQAASTQSFVYDQGNMALAFNGAGSLTNRYLWGPGSNQILADEVLDPTHPGQAGTTYWPLADNQGTIRDIADSTGHIVDHLAYDSFGNVTGETGDTTHTAAALDMFFGYIGGFHDPDTGLDLLGVREYDPNTATWLQKDPISFAGGDSNLRRYSGNDPINESDPNGMAPGDAEAAWIDSQLSNSVTDTLDRFIKAREENFARRDSELDVRRTLRLKMEAAEAGLYGSREVSEFANNWISIDDEFRNYRGPAGIAGAPERLENEVILQTTGMTRDEADLAAIKGLRHTFGNDVELPDYVLLNHPGRRVVHAGVGIVANPLTWAGLASLGGATDGIGLLTGGEDASFAERSLVFDGLTTSGAVADKSAPLIFRNGRVFFNEGLNTLDQVETAANPLDSLLVPRERPIIMMRGGNITLGNGANAVAGAFDATDNPFIIRDGRITLHPSLMDFTTPIDAAPNPLGDFLGLNSGGTRTTYWWTGRYTTGASQHGAYQASGGKVFPTARNSALTGAELSAEQEAFTVHKLAENNPIGVVYGQAAEAGLTVFGKNVPLEADGVVRLAQRSAQAAIERAIARYEALYGR